MKPTDAHKRIKIFILKTLLWPSFGRCITKDGYIELVQKFVNQCTD
jgi:hypothetical protein